VPLHTISPPFREHLPIYRAAAIDPIDIAVALPAR
jgi:hypothetical protein